MKKRNMIIFLMILILSLSMSVAYASEDLSVDGDLEDVSIDNDDSASLSEESIFNEDSSSLSEENSEPIPTQHTISSNSSSIDFNSSIKIYTYIENTTEMDSSASTGVDNTDIYLNGELIHTTSSSLGYDEDSYFIFDDFTKWGWYNFTSLYRGNDNFLPSSSNLMSFYLEPIEVGFHHAPAVTNTTVGITVPINFYLYFNDNETKLTYVHIDVYVNDSLDSSPYTNYFYFHPEALGTYVITAYYNGSDVYSPCNASCICTVDKRTTSMSIGNPRVGANDGERIIPIDVYDEYNLPAFSGLVDIYVNGEKVSTINYKTSDTYSFYPPASGDYNITACFLGDVRYLPSNASRILSFMKESQISTDLPYYNNVRIGDELVINASLLDADGRIIYDDIDVAVIHELYGGDEEIVSTYLISHGNGSVNVDTSSLIDGEYYRALISYKGSSAYNPSNYSVSGGLPYILPKERIPTTLLFDGFEEFSTTDYIDLEFNLLDNWKWYSYGVDGARIIGESIYVYLNDELYTVKLIEESSDVPIRIEGLNSGENSIKFLFNGTEIFESSIYEFTIIHYNVRSEIRFEGLDYSQDYGNDIAFNSVLFDTKTDEVINQDYSLLVYTDNDYYFNQYNPMYQVNVNGNETVILPSTLFSRGNTYWVVAKYDGNENISSYTQSASFQIDDDRENTEISIDLSDIAFHDDLKCTINLLTSDSSLINESIRILIYTFDSWCINDPAIVNISSNANEEIVLATSDLNPDRYVLKAIFEGNDFYKPCEDYEFFNIAKRSTSLVISSDKTSFDLGQKATIRFNLSDGNCDIIAPIVLNVNGDNITVVDGQYEFAPDKAGTYNLTARFLGNGSYNPSQSNILSLVFKVPDTNPTVLKSTKIICRNMTTSAIDIKVDGKRGAYFNLTLKDASNKPLAGKAVKITISKSTYTVKTNSNGIAKLRVNLKKAGKYRITVSFAGDSAYKASSASAIIKVNKQKPKLVSSKRTFKRRAKTKKVTAKLTTGRGKVLKAKRIVFTLNRKSYAAKTNSKGIAVVKVKLYKRGKYTCRIRYAGDKTYASAVKKIRVIVK